MKTTIFKIALALTVIAGATFTGKAQVDAVAKPDCIDANNTCYVLTGPDGDHASKSGVLVYPASN